MQRLDTKVFSKVKDTVNTTVKDTVNTVKDTIRKITTGDETSPPNPLVVMNIPPLMARRDAAYDRAIHLLREHIFSLPEEERRSVYATVLELLEVAIDATKSIPRSKKSRGKQTSEPGPILQYLSLLNDTIQAALALVKHELILFKEEKALSNFIGSEISSQFISTEEIFSNSEMNIYHCISDLIDMAEPAIARNREYRKKSFTKNELDRYNKALNEFTSLYCKFGEEQAEG